MDDDSPCNGWSNYETWAVNLWLTNDQGRMQRCLALVAEADTLGPDCSQVQDGIWTPEKARIFLLSDRLKEMVEKQSPLHDRPSMFADLLDRALERVDWHEIARDHFGISSPV